MVGRTIGHYRITARLGAGGMGEVYLAYDERLGRNVAIKFVHHHLADDEPQRRRFEREARIISGLNHPNICTLYDIGREGDADYLVLEHIEGESLASRLARGPLPIRDALRVAMEVAAALDVAHRSGIVHRDLKPGNIMLTRSGAKLLDFGLAKTSPVRASTSTTVQAPDPITARGSIVGTFQYMAPEQIEGREADQRSDIFALGSVLYEMVCGRRPFEGRSEAALLAAILEHEPAPLSEVQPLAPPSLARIVACCLSKDPEARFQTAHDLKFALDAVASGSSQTLAGAVVVPNRTRWMRFAAGVALLLLGAVIGRVLAPDQAPGAPVRTTIPLPAGLQLDGWGTPVVTISPDGRMLAFVARSASGVAQLYLRRMDQADALPVPGGEEAEGPFFSPDSEWVAFAAGASGASGMKPELRKHSTRTGLTQSICDVGDYFGGTWAPDGSIYFAGVQPGGLMKVSAEGGTAEPVASSMRWQRNPEQRSLTLYWPQRLPNGHVLVTVTAPPRLAVLDPGSGELRDLGVSAGYGRYVPAGYLLYATDDAKLFGAAFDSSSATVTGPPVAVISDIALSGNLGAVFSVSDTGTLVFATGYLRGSYYELRQIVRVTRTGQVEPLPFEPEMFNRMLSLSPDGRRAAASIWEGPLWIYDLEQQTRIQLPDGDIGFRDWPSWSPDGTRVVFAAEDFEHADLNLFWQAADGSNDPQRLIVRPLEENDSAWTSAGSTIVFTSIEDLANIWQMPFGEPDKARRLLSTPPGDAGAPAISPDGRWLAYVSSETGTFEVFAQAFPGLGRKTPISRGPGQYPRWSRDGREIFFRNGSRFMAVRVRPGADLSPAPPALLFENDSFRRFDVLPGSQGFITLRQLPDSGIISGLHVVSSWFEELRTLIGPGRPTP